jgi:glucokinase
MASLSTTSAPGGHTSQGTSIVGVDIGGTKVAVAVADRAGAILARAMRPTTAGDGALAALQRVFEAVDEACGRAGTGAPAVLGVGAPGISVPGGGNQLCPNIPGWAPLDLYAMFEQRFGCPFAIHNDIKTATLGEGWCGAARGARSFVYVGVGTGIAAGIVVEGRLWEGAHGASGEIGYWAPSATEMAADLRAGRPVMSFRTDHTPLEEQLSGRWIGERAAALASSGAAPLLHEMAAREGGAVTARLLFQAAAEGDAGSRDLVEEVTYLLAVSLAHLAIVLDPELFVIGGGLAGAGAALLAPMERVFDELVPFPPRVVLSTLGSESGLYGAVRVALDLAQG